jgi:hypothetical protein
VLTVPTEASFIVMGFNPVGNDKYYIKNQYRYYRDPNLFQFEN